MSLDVFNHTMKTLSEFIEDMPKIELHAHLNGSLSSTSMRELGEALNINITEEFLQAGVVSTTATDDLNACFKKFAQMHQLTATKQGLALATHLVIREFANDNVVYLELRTTPKANENMTKLEYLQCVLDAILKAQQEQSKILVKLLPSFDRSKPVFEAAETLRSVLELRKKYEQILVGIDLSGNPNMGKFRDFMPLLSEARENGLKLAVHCAELDNPAEVEEMLEFGMQRCGHGTFLSEKQLLRLTNDLTTIECCLTSNVRSKTAFSYENHHFGKIISKYPENVVLATDDSGVFETTLSNEFLIAAKTFDLGKEELKMLSLNAVKSSFCSNEEKTNCVMMIAQYNCMNSVKNN